MDHIALFVKDGQGKQTILIIRQSSSIRALFTKISRWTGISMNYQDVIFAGRILQEVKNGRRQYLSDYSINDRSMLFVVVSLKSSRSKEYEKFQDGVEFTKEPDMLNWCEDPDNPRAKMPCGHPNYRLLQEMKNGRRQYLSDYSIYDRSMLSVVVSLKSSRSKEYEKFQDGVEFTEEQDMLNWCEDPDNPRAKMPCGHPICADTLIDYCQSLLNEGKYEFQCPFIDNETMHRCGMIWDYDVIRQILILTEEEKEIFETKLSDNLLKSSPDMRTCPNCRVSCTRQNITDKRIQCLMCEKYGKRYEFCWQCLGEWKSSGTENCGNTNCCTEDQLFDILREAPVKNIIGLEGCPSIRACPKCGNLISHKEACKHMACPCGTKFCFICLKMADDTGYKCGSFNSKCTIAPRQGHVKCDNRYETNNVSSNNSTESAQDSFHETLFSERFAEDRIYRRSVVPVRRTVTRETTPSPRPRNNSCVIL